MERIRRADTMQLVSQGLQTRDIDASVILDFKANSAKKVRILCSSTELQDAKRYFNQFVMTNSVAQERNIFPVFCSELLHVKHSAVEQNLLQVTTCKHSKLDKISRLEC